MLPHGDHVEARIILHVFLDVEHLVLDLLTIALPGFGLGFMCLSASRHMWGGEGNQERIPFTGILLFLLEKLTQELVNREKMYKSLKFFHSW